MKQQVDIKAIGKAIDKFSQIIEEGFKDPDRATAVQALMEELGKRFFECPASYKVDFHGCYPGGLVVHTINVVKNLAALNKLFMAEDKRYPLDTILLVGCFHDIGKIGSLTEPFYIDNLEEWQVRKGQLYAINPKLITTSHAVRSVLLLQHFGVKLTDEEAQAIIYHDGQYIEDNKSIRNQEQPLTLLINWADHAALRQEKGEMTLNTNGIKHATEENAPGDTG